jgi:hypothetical protein
MSNVPTRVPSFTEKTASGENITIDPSRIQGGVNGLAAEVGRDAFDRSNERRERRPS